MEKAEHIPAAPAPRPCCDAGDGHVHEESHDHGHDHDHDREHSPFRAYLPGGISLLLLLGGIAMDHYIDTSFFKGPVRLLWYLAAYAPVGLPVLREALDALRKGSFFNEFTLMVLATSGAFAIGEYPEGVAVMLFYAIGELFQGAAVRKSKDNIRALLDVRPATASLVSGDTVQVVRPEQVRPGDIIQVKAGEKVPLDGEMLSEGSSFNTSALTGESKPKSIYRGETVLAGMLNIDRVAELKVTKKFEDSSLAQILDLVRNATGRKARTELLIRRFARVYTPVVFFLALGLVTIPYFFTEGYVFKDWLYRGLVFLVISCPCALVISIPLGYFGGIGAASRNGILFKGSNFLDLMTRINTVVMDKTGTLTRGVFRVQRVEVNTGDFPALTRDGFLNLLAALEHKSNHPVAKAIVAEAPGYARHYRAEDVREIAGHGLEGRISAADNAAPEGPSGHILAGNTRLLAGRDIAYDPVLDTLVESVVAVAVNGKYAGYVLLADELKADVPASVRAMRAQGVTRTVMLSGDKHSIVQKVAAAAGIDIAYGDLLPGQKVSRLEELKKDRQQVIAFVGDGINDAPVLAMADIGMAMGGMGSDAAIEVADVVLQTDEPSRIVTAIRVARATKRIVIQNIVLAFAVKGIVLLLGAGGLATMWEAVFADVGVALLAILNAVRIQHMSFD